MSGFIKKLRTVKRSAPQDETDVLILQFQQVEQKTKRICKDLRKHGEAMGSMAKAQHRIASEFYQSVYGRASNDSGVDKSRTRGPTRLILKRVPEVNIFASAQLATADLQQEMLLRLRQDEERMMMDPLKKYSLMFPSVSATLTKRESRKQDLEKANAKVEKYKEKNSPKLDSAQLEAKRSKDDFTKVDSIVVAELPHLYAGRIDFFEICLGCYIQAQKMYFEQMAGVHTDTLVKLGYDTAEPEVVAEKLDDELDDLFGELATLSVTNSAAAKSSKAS